MVNQEGDLVPGDPDPRAFLRRMVAVGLALPVVTTFDSMFGAEEAGKDPCHDHGHGHGHGHGHKHCSTTTRAPTTTAAPSTTTRAPTTTAAPSSTTRMPTTTAAP